MINFKFAFLAFLACIALSDALKCYECHANRRTGCGKGEVNGMKEVDCDEVVGCLSYKSEGELAFRGCSNIQTNREEICQIAEKHFYASECTSCYEDLCNGSPFKEEDE